jgi:hypothetical protein
MKFGIGYKIGLFLVLLIVLGGMMPLEERVHSSELGISPAETNIHSRPSRC